MIDWRRPPKPLSFGGWNCFCRLPSHLDDHRFATVMFIGTRQREMMESLTEARPLRPLVPSREASLIAPSATRRRVAAKGEDAGKRGDPGKRGDAGKYEALPRQRTLAQAIDCAGIGLHGGRRVRLALYPAAPGTGIVFRRSDLGVDIPARFDAVADTRLCTEIAAPDQPEIRIGTIEHVMAALVGCGVDNAVVEVDGPEIPILDGSAAPFVFLIDCAGTVEQEAYRRVIEILRPIEVHSGAAFAALLPATPDRAFGGLEMALSIDFAASAIGRQELGLRLDEAGFRRELASARTFTLAAEIEALRASGRARGGSLENAVVVDGARVLNPGGLRAPDEFVRHKLLDAVGDLALAGAVLRGRFHAHCSGHGLNNRLLRALFATPDAWVEIAPAPSARLSAAA